MADYILGIDAGGTAVKAAVYALTGEERGVTARPFRPITPAPGHAERDPEQLWSGLCAVIKEAMALGTPVIIWQLLQHYRRRQVLNRHHEARRWRS